MGERSVVGISASKVVALIGSLILIADSVSMILTLSLYNILVAILGFVGAAIIILSLKIVDLKKVNIPYEWWILLIVGIGLLVLYLLGAGTAFLRGTIIILIAAGVEILVERKSYAASQLVAIVGAFLAIFFSILSMQIVPIIIGVVCGVLLILALIEKVNIPFSWWVVLILGFVVFTWADPIGGTVILIAFILMLMSY